MTDYRKRRPPSFERPTMLSVLRSAPIVVVAAEVLAWIGVGLLGYAVAVALGLAW